MGVTVDAWTTECAPRPRLWIIPVTFLGTLLAVAAGFLLLAWAGPISSPRFGGPYPPSWFVFPFGFALLWFLVLLVARPWRWWGAVRWERGWAYSPSPEEIVRARFARGEISKDQMARLLSDLSEDSGERHSR